MNRHPFPLRLQLAITAALALLMAATRLHHFLPVPDASWALFFAGGFYLAGASRWAFPALMLVAVLIDSFAIEQAGVSDFCLTPAYWALVPTHAVMWLGGRLLRKAPFDAHGLAALLATTWTSTTLAYGISNGAFYWLGGRYAEPHWTQYIERFFLYYPHFLAVTAGYLLFAATLHLAFTLALRSRQPEARG